MNREDKFKSKCYDFVRTNYKQIPSGKIVNSEFALSNSACHFNCVAAVNSGRADKAWMVWAGGSVGVIHFINSKSGKFFDETWQHADNRMYHIIRQIDPSEFESTYELLCASKRMMFNINGSFLDKVHGNRKIHDWI